MNILVISGFLGSGKTTFIKSLVRNSKKKIAILENEYGSNVDGDILRKEKELNVWEMTDGCICCSSKSDFASSVLTIANTINPDYLVIEPTGVAQLSNIINNLKQIEYERIIINSPITIVDCINFNSNLGKYRDYVIDQIKQSSNIILSKTENLNTQEINIVVDKIKSINKNAKVYDKHYSNFDKAMWNLFLATRFDGVVLDSCKINRKLDKLSLVEVEVSSIQYLLCFLEDIVRGEYGSIYRAKGLIKVSSSYMRFDIVDGLYSIIEDETCFDSKVNFIGYYIYKDKIKRALNKENIISFKRNI